MIPGDWSKGLIVKLQKKGENTECSNWRGITLLSLPSEVFVKYYTWEWVMASALFSILSILSIILRLPSNVCTTIKLFYKNFCCRILHSNMSTDWFNITSTGVRQGCVMSPIFFLVAIVWVMCKTIGNQKRGIRWTLCSTLEDLQFADNIALLASPSYHLQSKPWPLVGKRQRQYNFQIEHNIHT